MFSELVDKIVEVSGRPDMLTDIIDNANTIIRKVHAQALFDRNFKTVEAHAQRTNPHEQCNYLRWQRPRDFKVLRTIQVGNDYLLYQRPGHHLQNATDYYYAQEDEFILVSKGIKSATIGYYRKPHRFTYYPVSQRPAIFSAKHNKWLYLVPSSNGEYTDKLTTDLLQDEARTNVQDWLINEYPDIIKFGVLNLVYSHLGDDQARSTYAIFKDAVADLLRVESYAATDN